MDDKTFNDKKIADEWIAIIENAYSKIRDDDIYPILNKWLEIASPTNILDLGSGQGICSDKINLTERNYVGVDPSPFLVERASTLYKSKNRQFVLGNIYNLPFLEHSFDAVFSISVWHLLSDLKKAGEELSRILKVGGHFLIITANPSASHLWKAPGSDDILYFHTLDEINAAFLPVNLRIHKSELFRGSKNSSEEKYYIAISGQKLLA